MRGFFVFFEFIALRVHVPEGDDWKNGEKCRYLGRG